jgi:hypothetical protein
LNDPRGEWFCPQCHSLNIRRAKRCTTCGVQRLAAAPPDDPLLSLSTWVAIAGTLMAVVAISIVGVGLLGSQVSRPPPAAEPPGAPRPTQRVAVLVSPSAEPVAVATPIDIVNVTPAPIATPTPTEVAQPSLAPTPDLREIRARDASCAAIRSLNGAGVDLAPWSDLWPRMRALAYREALAGFRAIGSTGEERAAYVRREEARIAAERQFIVQQLASTAGRVEVALDSAADQLASLREWRESADWAPLVRRTVREWRSVLEEWRRIDAEDGEAASSHAQVAEAALLAGGNWFERLLSDARSAPWLDCSLLEVGGLAQACAYTVSWPSVIDLTASQLSYVAGRLDVITSEFLAASAYAAGATAEEMECQRRPKTEQESPAEN